MLTGRYKSRTFGKHGHPCRKYKDKRRGTKDLGRSYELRVKSYEEEITRIVALRTTSDEYETRRIGVDGRNPPTALGDAADAFGVQATGERGEALTGYELRVTNDEYEMARITVRRSPLAYARTSAGASRGQRRVP